MTLIWQDGFMPFEYQISTEERIIYVTGSGPELIDEKLIQEILNHPDYDPTMNVLCDFREFGPAPHPKDMKEIAKVYKKYKDHIKGNLAFVVPPSEVRKASILAELVRVVGIRMEMYGDIDSAKKFFETGISWVK